MALRATDFLIDDETHHDTHDDLVNWKGPDGLVRARGGIPRDYTVQPESMFQAPDAIKLIPRSEWSARIKELEATKSLVSNVRETMNNGGSMPSLDQGQVGYCWAHSTTHNMMLLRGIRNMKYVPLSAYSIAATIKKGRDEGGWCGLSGEFVGKTGIAPQSVWPQGDRSYSKYQTSDVQSKMALYASVEDWLDLGKGAYDRNMTFDQVMSLLLSGLPGAVDFNWWGHSVCAVDPVEVEAGSFGIRILNSWSDSWGDKGLGVLRGNKAIPDGAITVRDVKTGESPA